MHKKCILGLFLGLTFTGLASGQIASKALAYLDASSAQAVGQVQAASQSQPAPQPQPAERVQPPENGQPGQVQPAGQESQTQKPATDAIPRETCPRQTDNPNDILGQTQEVLAHEWLSETAVPNMLHAMKDYIEHHPLDAVHEVEIPGDDSVKSLYEDAQLLADGKKSALGTANFLVMLASANTRNVPKLSDDCKMALIDEAKAVLSTILRDSNKRKALIKSNFLFSRGDCCAYEAMYKLLSAVPGAVKDDNPATYKTNVEDYLSNLESLRAAYALGDGQLAAAVAALVEAPAQ